MVLLDLYRGTFDRERHPGSPSSDVSILASQGFFKMGEITPKGKTLVTLLLRVASLGE
jgi:hypothetical protein